MPPVILQMGVSIDGYVAGPGGLADLGRAAEHPDVTAWKPTALSQAGTHIMGSVTYAAMAAHWPSSTQPYAPLMNDVPKVVFSASLDAGTWPETRVARGELTKEITALKAQPGGDIIAHGGAAFVQALSRQGLIDEYRLVIRPVALGGGLPLFKDLSDPLPLRLVEATTFPDGTAIHVYRPAARD